MPRNIDMVGTKSSPFYLRLRQSYYAADLPSTKKIPHTRIFFNPFVRILCHSLKRIYATLPHQNRFTIICRSICCKATGHKKEPPLCSGGSFQNSFADGFFHQANSVSSTNTISAHRRKIAAPSLVNTQIPQTIFSFSSISSSSLSSPACHRLKSSDRFCRYSS